MRVLLDRCHYFFFNTAAPAYIYTLSLHDALPILPHHDRQAHRREEINDRRYAGLVSNAFHESLKIAFTVFVKAPIQLLLLRQALDNSDGGQCFLGQRSEMPCAHTGLAVRFLNEPLVTKDHPQHSRSNRESGKGEFPIDPEH